MRASTAFENIDNPLDPAWHGHAQAVQGMGRRRWLRGVVVALVVVVAVALIVVAVQRRVDDAGGTARASESGSVDNRSSSDSSDTLAQQPYPASEADVDQRTNAGATPSVAPAAMPAPAPRTGTASAARAAPPATLAPAAPASSGWAPAAATVAPQDAGSGLLVGDLAGINPVLIQRLDQLAVALGREVESISGWRTRHEQSELYDRFLNGTGNLAAVPGTSNHETGSAADVYVDGVALANVPGAAEHARLLGLHFPVSGEAWHVEMIETSRR